MNYMINEMVYMIKYIEWLIILYVKYFGIIHRLYCSIKSDITKKIKFFRKGENYFSI